MISTFVVIGMLGIGDERPFAFERTTIDSRVEIGYGLAIADVDADGKDDILLADRRQFAWFRNGSWERVKLHDALTERDNVCIAARRDSNRVLAIGLGGDWGPTDTTKPGCAAYGELRSGETTLTTLAIAAEPTVHRMRFIQLANVEPLALVIAPLHGRGNVDGQGDPVAIEAFVPERVGEKLELRRERIDATLHKTHNFDVLDYSPEIPGEEVLVIGVGGVRLAARVDGTWQSRTLEGIRDGGEIRAARLENGRHLIATIEPMHGNVLALYREREDGSFARTELDTTLAEGHGLALADLDRDGEIEVIAGWRQKDAKGEVGIRIYRTSGASESFRLDSQTACEDLKVSDLDADGRLDIIAAGRASHDLTIFWNRTAN